MCPDGTSRVLVFLLDNKVFLNDFVQTYKNRIQNRELSCFTHAKMKRTTFSEHVKFLNLLIR